MRLISKVKSVLADVRRFGLWPALHIRMCRYAEALVGAMCLRIVRIEPDDLQTREYLEELPGYNSEFLSAERLRREARSHPDLNPEFIEEALARGDRCYALLSEDSLAAYGWYATVPTPIDDAAVFQFASDWVYMYKGYTSREHRGRRLHGIGMSRALVAFGDEGYRGLISFVASSNYASLRSCARMGYQVVGSVRWLGVGTKRRFFHSRSSRRAGVRVAPATAEGPTASDPPAREPRLAA